MCETGKKRIEYPDDEIEIENEYEDENSLIMPGTNYRESIATMRTHKMKEAELQVLYRNGLGNGL